MKRFINILLVLLGNLIYALSVKLFLLPAGLLTGGSNGIALVLEHYWNVPISMFVLIFNIVMLLVGWFVLGRAFAMTTVISSFVYPAYLEILDRLMGDVVLTNDLLLCTIFFGLGVGLAAVKLIDRRIKKTGKYEPRVTLEKKI